VRRAVRQRLGHRRPAEAANPKAGGRTLAAQPRVPRQAPRHNVGSGGISRAAGSARSARMAFSSYAWRRSIAVSGFRRDMHSAPGRPCDAKVLQTVLFGPS
jgi:hypothetical protein